MPNNYTTALLITVFFCFFNESFGGINTDSLSKVFASMPDDTIKVVQLNTKANDQIKKDLGTALILVQQSVLTSERIGHDLLFANSLKLKAKILRKQGNNKEAIKDYKAAFLLYEKSGKTLSAAKVLNSIGARYFYMKDLSNALSFFKRSAELRAKVKDSIGMAKVYNNIGEIYRMLEEYDKALENHDRSLSFKKQLKDTVGIISSLENIGTVNYDLKHIDIALRSYKSALIYSNKSKKTIPGIYYGMSRCYNELQMVDSCIVFINRAINIAENKNNSYLKTVYYKAFGDFLCEKKEYKKAKINYEKSLYISKKHGYLQEEKFIQQALSKLYEQKNEFERSLKAHKRFYFLDDSLRGANHANIIKETELKYEFKMQTEARDLEVAQKEFKQLLISISLFIGLLISGFGLFYVNRTRRLIKKKNAGLQTQQDEIEKQNKKLESLNETLTEKTNKVTSSINYAKKIQQAILASDEYIKKNIKDIFILFLPRDIVSGDFYWVYKSPKKKIYISAVDCTGHGVPGAFMSMIGNSILNELIIERKITKPDAVLNEMKRKIILSLKQKGFEGEARDGMDMTLCEIDKENQMLRFSGANNPIYIIRDEELIVIKGDSQPIGFQTDHDPPFTLHETSLKAGDIIYMFSDGFPDQFGGPRGKKYMYRSFKSFLLKIHKTPIYEQREILKKEFLDWKGNEAQVDDVCVMGYEFKPS